MKLRQSTTKTGVMMAAPTIALPTSGTSVPCRKAFLTEFPLDVRISSTA
ncbi:MAG TPA: hypothetical protein VL912_01610 [Candidatus Udaeobacter sp.]|nr:hypothetical protein [Candidatus Udaeobacter sp.]